jgi:hypothetical protein
MTTMNQASDAILLDNSQEIIVDTRPMGPLPQSEVDAICTKLKEHKHLFTAQAKVTEGACPGHDDFCHLYRIRVPVSSNSLSGYGSINI